MQKLIFYFIFSVLLFACVNLQQGPLADPKPEREVVIEFKANASTFPAEWKTKEINATAEDLDSSEMERSSKIIRKALAKYPEKVLEANLDKVYVFKSIKFYGVVYGGTNAYKKVYLGNSGLDDGYTDLYIEQAFHHEFSSVLLLNYPDYFPEKEWKALNGFEYFDESGGVESIKNGTDGVNFEQKYLEAGFLFQYGASSLENDLNSFAENAFSQSEEFKGFLIKYPKIRRKYELFIAFYSQIDPEFSSAYFKKELLQRN